MEVLAYAPVDFFHCQHCELVWHETGASQEVHREQITSSLPDDLMAEYQQLSDWVREMISIYGERLRFKIIDAASIEGWLKSVCHGLHRYPTIILEGTEKIVGRDFERATAVIRERMLSSSSHERG